MNEPLLVEQGLNLKFDKSQIKNPNPTQTMRHLIKEEKVGDMSFDRLGLCFWQFWLNELATPNEWMWSNKPPNWARLNSNERCAPSLPTSGGLKWHWRQNYSDEASKVGNPVSSDSIGWSSWQLETNEYEATDVQN